MPVFESPVAALETLVGSNGANVSADTERLELVLVFVRIGKRGALAVTVDHVAAVDGTVSLF